MIAVLTASPVLSPLASWILVGALIVTVGAFFAPLIAAGPDVLAEPEVEPVPFGQPLHEICEAEDCTWTICFCEQVENEWGNVCLATFEPGCSHPGSVCCDEHRLEVCLDCRLDAMDDAGLLG